MRLVPFAALALGLSLAAVDRSHAADDKDDDVKRIQGTWVIDPAMYKDLKDPEAVKAAKAVRVIFEGDTVTFLAKTHREDSSSRERSSDRA